MDGRILLVQRLKAPEAGCWGLAGGKIDLYETAAEAAVREVHEETGIVVVADDVLCVADQIDRDAQSHWIAPVFLATAYEGEPRNLEPTKHGGVAWFPLNALPAPLTAAATQGLKALAAR